MVSSHASQIPDALHFRRYVLILFCRVRIRHARSQSKSFMYIFSSEIPISENWIISLPFSLSHFVPPSSRVPMGLNSCGLGAPPPPPLRPPSSEGEENDFIFEDDNMGKPSDLYGAPEGWTSRMHLSWVVGVMVRCCAFGTQGNP
jgi:hypothetical protein